MKTAAVASFLLLVPLAAQADSDPPFKRAASDAQVQSWPQCIVGIDYDLADPELHLDAQTKVPALDKAVGTLAAGSTPTAAELRAACLAQAKADPNALHVWTDEMWTRVGDLLGDIKQMQEHPYDFSYETLAKEVPMCEETANVAAEVLGADATIEWEGKWKGTIAQAKAQICGVARKAADAQKAKMLEPFVKAGIKADKLKIIDEYNVSVEIGIPGGEFTLEPKKLAKANPWFSSSTGDSCGDDHVITHLHRYQFDGAQKLVKESTKDYCGAVPKSAYR
jgi:hypothetical protein